jgi:hypothetical protein
MHQKCSGRKGLLNEQALYQESLGSKECMLLQCAILMFLINLAKEWIHFGESLIVATTNWAL